MSNKKIEELAETTSLSGVDLLLVNVDNGDGSFTSKKVKISNLPSTTSSNTIEITGSTRTITSADNGKVLSNYGAVTNTVWTMDTLANLGDGFGCRLVNEVINEIPTETVAMLHMDGTNGGTTFTDVIGSSWTAGGNAVTDTSDKVFGVSSYHATNGSIKTPNSTKWQLGTIWAMNFRIKFNSFNGSLIAHGGWGSSDTTGWNLMCYGGNTLKLFSKAGSQGDLNINFSWTPSLGVWYDLELDADGTKIHCFINGTEIGTGVACTENFVHGVEQLVIGNDWKLEVPISGFIDEVRITKGKVWHTANFTSATHEFYSTKITLSPPSGSKLPLTSAINRNLVSSAMGDSMEIGTTAHNYIGKSVYPAAANWVDTAQ